MHLLPAPLLAAMVAGLAAAAPSQCISTFYARNNGGSNGGAVYFDLNVTNPNGITINSLDTNTAELVPFGLDLYVAPNTHAGNETNAAVWTLTSSGTGVGQGNNNPSAVDLVDFLLAPGSYGIALVMSAAAGHDYTNGSNTFTNPDVTLTTGTASNVPFTATIFNPRTWNGTLYYSTPGGAPCAEANAFGIGCISASPLTATASRPVLGTTVRVDTTNVPPNTLVGTNLISLVIFDPGIDLTGLGAPGCFQYANLEASVVWFPAGSTAQMLFTVPNNQGLSGVTFAIQSVSFTPGINQFGLATSNGIRMIVGL